MLVNLHALRSREGYPVFSISSMANVDGQLWVVYNEGSDIVISRRINDVWMNQEIITTGRNPTITYDGFLVCIYFENNGKIQRLDMRPDEFGPSVRGPLQLWDCFGTDVTGITNIGVNYISPIDTFPLDQPVPSSLAFTPLELTWAHTTSYPDITRMYAIWENGVFIGEVTSSKLDTYIKPFSIYQISSVYYQYGIRVESLKATIETKELVYAVDEFKSSIIAGFANISVSFTDYDSDTFSEGNAVFISPQSTGFVNISATYTDYEVDSIIEGNAVFMLSNMGYFTNLTVAYTDNEVDQIL